MGWWSWGSNDVGQVGRTGGVGSPLLDAQPTSFPAGVDITDLNVSERAGVGCSSTGDIYVWGFARIGGQPNTRCKFGNQFGATAPASVNPPTRLTYPEAIGAVQVGQSETATFWRRGDGSIWGVGLNIQGEFGTGEAQNTYHPTPVQLTGFPSGARAIRPVGASGGLYVIDSTSQLWYSGGNDVAQDGSGMAGSNILTARVVANLPGPVLDVALTFRPTASGVTGGASIFALMSDTTIMWWARSMLGAPSATNSTPQVLTGVSNIAQIYGSSAGGATIYFRTTANSVSGLGSDQFGALCNGSGSGASYVAVDHFALPPVPIVLPGSRTASYLMRTGSAATFAAFVLSNDQQVWGWGLNDRLWGDSDPGLGTGVAIVPPYVVMPSTFSSTAHLPIDVLCMGESALFVREAPPLPRAIPSRLATIVG